MINLENNAAKRSGRTASEIICAIETSHGEVTLAPGDLLTLTREIRELEEQLDSAGERLMGEDL